MPFPRITIRPDQLEGQPCIRGLRIPVSLVVGLVAQMTTSEILDAYPDLEQDDIREALLYAAELARTARENDAAQ
ncbi:MAG: DUF433 domain-containing protein [Deltaproteobacteria bacterium]|nr:DUF433 domain-containing protein [Deltaproteobacteria bacterium]